MHISSLITCCLALTLLAAPSLTTPSFAAQDTMPPVGWRKDNPKTQIERGLSLMVQGKMDDAFKTLFGKASAKDVLDKLKFELYSITKKSGKPYAYEQLLEQKAGTRLMRYRYLLMLTKQPVVFDFYYYKNKKGWTLRNISYSKDVKKIFTP